MFKEVCLNEVIEVKVILLLVIQGFACHLNNLLPMSLLDTWLLQISYYGKNILEILNLLLELKVGLPSFEFFGKTTAHITVL